MTIRLALADDERLVRTALRAVLGAEPTRRWWARRPPERRRSPSCGPPPRTSS